MVRVGVNLIPDAHLELDDQVAGPQVDPSRRAFCGGLLHFDFIGVDQAGVDQEVAYCCANLGLADSGFVVTLKNRSSVLKAEFRARHVRILHGGACHAHTLRS